MTKLRCGMRRLCCEEGVARGRHGVKKACCEEGVLRVWCGMRKVWCNPSHSPTTPPHSPTTPPSERTFWSNTSPNLSGQHCTVYTPYCTFVYTCTVRSTALLSECSRDFDAVFLYVISSRVFSTNKQYSVTVSLLIISVLIARFVLLFLSRVFYSMKPTPLSSVFIPPVTGVGGDNLPVSNSYDPSGNFPSRPRGGSFAKRQRTDAEAELGAAFDLSRDFPPVSNPAKPVIDPGEIKTLLVAASAISAEVIPALDAPDAPPELKKIATMMLSFVALMEAVVEKGIVPLAAAAANSTLGGGGAGRGFATTARRQLNPPTSPKPPTPGRRELVDALEKSEKESVLFNADLGKLEISNRSVLNANLSSALKKQTEEKASKDRRDSAENIRLVDDALSCVENMEFLGQRSKKFINKSNLDDPRNNTFTTMPIRFEFASRAGRVNFEWTLRDCCGARVVQSYPEPIRKEMAIFRNALQERYPDEIVMVRPDTTTL